MTRSSLKKENEDVVQFALENKPPKTSFKLSPVPLKLPVTIAKSFQTNFLRLNSTEEGSGLFLCTLTQNSIQDPKDLLRKSALKGLTRPKKSESSVTAQASCKQIVKNYKKIFMTVL